MSLSAVTKSSVEFYLRMTIDELSEWIVETNEYLRERAETFKRR